MAHGLKIGRKKFIMTLSVVALLLCAAILIFLFPVRYIDEPYEYPILPQSEEWKALGSNSERMASLNIPWHQLRHMTTESLVETIYQYPVFLVHYGITPYPAEVYSLLKEQFNALPELESRSDAADALIKAYCAMDVQYTSNPDESFQILFLEIILGQKIFLEQMSLQQRQTLLTIATEKLQEEKQVWTGNEMLARHYIGTFFTAVEKSGFGSEFPRP